MNFLTVILFTVSVSFTVGEEVVVNRTCESYHDHLMLFPNTTANISSVEGKWYEVAKYGKQENCTTDEIVHHPNSIQVIHRNETHNYTYYMFPENNTSMGTVLKIDNTTYILWSCSEHYNNSFFSNQTLKVLSKSNTTWPESTILTIQSIFNDSVALSFTNYSAAICNKSTNTSTNATLPSPSAGNDKILSVSIVLTVALTLFISV